MKKNKSDIKVDKAKKLVIKKVKDRNKNSITKFG